MPVLLPQVMTTLSGAKTARLPASSGCLATPNRGAVMCGTSTGEHRRFTERTALPPSDFLLATAHNLTAACVTCSTRAVAAACLIQYNEAVSGRRTVRRGFSPVPETPADGKYL
jgi:hypothetical protein